MKVVHCKREPYDTYIGRPSKWGNPFTDRVGTLAEKVLPCREDAIAAYDEWIRKQPELLTSLPELAGKVLGCWCAPKSCHGDVLIRLCRERGLIE